MLKVVNERGQTLCGAATMADLAEVVLGHLRASELGDVIARIRRAFPGVVFEVPDPPVAVPVPTFSECVDYAWGCSVEGSEGGELD